MSKEYAVKCSASVMAGNTFAEEVFQKRIAVVSPKTGRELRNIRVDYLSAGNTFQVGEVLASREVTFQKILKGFETAKRTPQRDAYVVGSYENLDATIMLTAKDLQNIYEAWQEWQDRQMDYAD